MTDKETNQNTLFTEHVQQAQQWVIQATEPSELANVAAKLAKLADDASKASLFDLAQGMEQWVRLLELAAWWTVENPDETQLVDDVALHVTQQLESLEKADEEHRSSLFAEMLANTEQQWGEYLELMDDIQAPGDEAESFWKEDEAESLDLGSDLGDSTFDTSQEEIEEEEVADEAGQASQIGLLLSAISNPEPSEVDEPVATELTHPKTETPSIKSPFEAPATDEPPAVSAAPVLPSQAETNEPSDESDFPCSEDDSDADAMKELAGDQELLEAYLDDALRCLQSMEQSAMTLESSSEDREPIQQFCRELHTLKGASASVGLAGLASYLHELETSLDSMFKDKSSVVKVDPMFEAVDRVRQKISDLTSPGSSTGPAETVRRTRNHTPDFSNFSSADDASIRIRAAKLDRLMDMLAELVVLRNRRESHVAEFNELNDELARCATRLRFAEEQPEFLESLEQPRRMHNGSQTISEIAKDITVVAQGLGELQSPVSQDNIAISGFIRDFRLELMQLRRVPISGLFNRLQRAARDAANAEQKQVQVKIFGESAGLEQEIQERLYEPLLHIVRNAVSHGIDTPENRTQSGKNPVGTVTVEASANTQQMVIEVRDDGGGVNYAAVRRRAVEQGLIVGNQMLTNDELAKLIFHPGFSTRQEASAVSGRGVGMDIVATAIEQLHGRIDIESEAGKGTTMRITIPLRTGIEHVMVFRSAGQLFAMPMQSVIAAKSSKADVDGIHVSLAELLSIGHDEESESEDVLILRTAKGRMHDRLDKASDFHGPRRMGLSVDEIVGPEEVVVRGLPAPLQGHPLFCGVTLSGAGETVLLLDGQRVEEFCKMRQLHLGTDLGQAGMEMASVAGQKRALVVDDSLSARKVLVKKLNSQGFATVEAGDGIEALERLRREQFDLVFTDLDMPRLGGMELLADIQSEKYTDAPVVVVSSRNGEEFQAKAIELGAAAYMNKPIVEKSFNQLMEELQLLSTAH